jgi:hypothetical protein
MHDPENMATASLKCSCCGEAIQEPSSWAFGAPDLWDSLSAADRELSELTPEACVVKEQFFFIKGVIQIPVLDADEGFSWCVWVSLSASNFRRVGEMWEDSKRVDEPPYFGWLCNSIPGYPETLHIKTMVHTRDIGLRPLIELEPTDHPLAIEQRAGITLERMRAIAEVLHHYMNPSQ